MIDLNELKKVVHANAVEKGFWDSDLRDEHCLMLTICEISEAVEADRVAKKEGKLPVFNNLHDMDDLVFASWYKGIVKGSIEEELADAFIRLLDLAGARAIDVVIYTDCKDAFVEELKQMQFCDSLYRICQILSSQFMLTGDIINISISMLYALSEKCEFDLDKHVMLKMRYNTLRKKMHGKLY